MFYLRPKTEKLEYGGRYDKLPTGTLAGGGGGWGQSLAYQAACRFAPITAVKDGSSHRSRGA
jgi:hypothetical protein